jgi:excinuclease ABC subunit A
LKHHTITAMYMNGEMKIEVPAKRREEMENS